MGLKEKVNSLCWEGGKRRNGREKSSTRGNAEYQLCGGFGFGFYFYFYFYFEFFLGMRVPVPGSGRRVSEIPAPSGCNSDSNDNG